MMPDRSSVFKAGKNLVLIVVIAGGYFVLGLLGLLFRSPVDSTGMLMPSTGLALAATLVLGNRVLSGIAIGSFCVSAWTYDFNPQLLPLYAISAFGSALSAFIGAGLIRKFIGFPNPLVKGKKILIFMLLAGPVSCLLAATIGITAMYGLKIIALKEIPLAWLRWWVGDILGVLIITPLVLVLFAEPQLTWYRRRKTVGLPVLMSFVLVFALYFYLSSIDRHQTKEQLKEKTVTLSQAVKNRVQLEIASLHGLKNFLLDSQLADSQEFSLVSKQMLLPFNEIQSITWINIPENEGEKNQIISVQHKSPNIDPESFKSITLYIKKKMQASPSYFETESLIPEQNGFKFIIPVLKDVNQKKKVLGAIIASVEMEGLVHQAFDSFNTANCSMTISTAQNSQPTSKLSEAKMIYTNTTSANNAPYQTISIPVADQMWKLSFYHDWGKEMPGRNWPVCSIIYCGLVFTGILSMILLQLTGRYFRTEAIIKARTKILTKTKTTAEMANQAKNQFLAKISHELRTPLNGISGFTQLLEKKPTLNAEDKKQVAIIKQCSDDLLSLINDILDISAIETHQINLEVNEFNFDLLLMESMQICKFKADEKGIKLVTTNSCISRDFYGDEKRIRQILVNLIDNAVKYTDKGSVTVAASYQDDTLKISVSDTGSGIAKHDIERIFSPFVQLNTGNFNREGIGLGLSITKELVNLMDGELTVSSQLGTGSNFSVSLPLPASEKNNEKSISSPGNDPNQHQAYVLAVDDSEINLLFLGSMLQHLGCKVDTAKDGQGALALIEKNNYDLALIDINMPIMNGMELIKILRNEGLKIKIKVVAISAYADEGKITEALSAGFDDYLTKPIEESQLIEIIQMSLSAGY